MTEHDTAATPAKDTTPENAAIEAFALLQETVNKKIIGQKNLVERLLIALLTTGHLLVEGAPGRAKTTAIKELAERIEGDFFGVMGLPLRLVVALLDSAGIPYRFTR